MLRILSYLALLAALNRPPDLEGKASHYADCFEGRLTRSEEVFRQNGFTAAVDDSRWPVLRDKTLLVCGEGSCVVVRANDTGYLSEWGIAVDLSKRAFRQLAPLARGVVQVRVWMMEEEKT